ncbi:MAG: hypothetical protein PHH73_00190 [Candidatus Rickettsiella isopodorum]|nr:hypothetical protein [Candidatus Rickettsiella isopodorum]
MENKSVGSWLGKPLESLDKSELLKVIEFLGNVKKQDDERHRHEMNILLEIHKAKNI